MLKLNISYYIQYTYFNRFQHQIQYQKFNIFYVKNLICKFKNLTIRNRKCGKKYKLAVNMAYCILYNIKI